MEPVAKVVYPTPPPTTNNLTMRQRSLLLRKAKKIEQILGYPPHLIDTLYHSDGTTPPSSPLTGPPNTRSSVDSSLSTLARLDSLENKDNVSWFCYPNGSRKSASTPSHNNRLSQTPLFRASLHLEVVAVNNLPAKPSGIPDQFHGSHETRLLPPPDSDLPPLKSSPTDPVIAVPTFTIPTSHTHRKAKMDRIRKRLGSEVPCEVVFPKNDCSEKLPPRRGDAVKKLDGSYQSKPSQWHLECRRTSGNERLSLIPECPDESFAGRQELTVDVASMKDGPGTPGSADSSLSMCSDGYGQGGMAFRKHSPSYRKPPPPILDDSVCAF